MLERGCLHRPGPDHLSDKKFVDSVTALVKQKRDEFQHVYDSVKAVNAVLQNDKDSLTAIVVSYEKNLDKQANDIGTLISDLNTAEAQRDTALSFAKCDSLKNAVLNAKVVVGNYIFSNDSLRELNNQIISTQQSIASRLNGQLTESNNALFQVQLKYQQLFSDYKKINKPKRFGIGPSAGAYITNQGIGYGIGIGVHYDLIKF